MIQSNNIEKKVLNDIKHLTSIKEKIKFPPINHHTRNNSPPNLTDKNNSKLNTISNDTKKNVKVIKNSNTQSKLI